MKVAVITPYYNESYSTLKRCHESVTNQSYKDINHIFVADGSYHPGVKTFENIEHISFPVSHNDTGATPRALAALSAFSRGYNAVAFLDADNTFLPNHVEEMASLMSITNADVVTATRNICNMHGDIMYSDFIESDGKNFCDTNCLFIGKSTLHLLSYWITEPAVRLWSDRYFWSILTKNNLTIANCKIPTVNYHSKWAWHYQHAGQNPPNGTVWIDAVNGQLVHKIHS